MFLNSSGLTDYITIKDAVARKLREEILMGILTPGQDLNLRELANRFKCSITPIREALSTLDGEGLISIDRHKTVKVIKLDPKEIEEIFEIRTLLEGYACGVAVSNINDRILEKLRTNIGEQEVSNGKKNYNKFFRLNHEFHKEIYECTNQSVLIEMITMLRNRTFHYVKTYTVLLNRCEMAISEHKEIFNAILERNQTAASELTKKHLGILAKSLNDYLKTKRN